MNFKGKKFLCYTIGAVVLLLIIAGVRTKENKTLHIQEDKGRTIPMVDSCFAEGVFGVRFDSLAKEYEGILEFSKPSEERENVFRYKIRDDRYFLMRFNNDPQELASEKVFFEGPSLESARFHGYSESYFFADAHGAIDMIQNSLGEPTRIAKKHKTTMMEWRGTQAIVRLVTITDKNSDLENACIILAITRLSKEEENNE